MTSELYSNLLGSSTAGIIARFMCHPIDTIKSRVQTSSHSTSQVIRQTLRLEGWRAFYKGVGPVILGGVPGVCLYLTTYEHVKKTLHEKTKLNPFLTYMTSAFTAETICCVIFVPVDVLKERMQVNKVTHSAAYSNTFHALRYILKEEGIRGIYRGYGATLASYGPFACLYFTLYEYFKSSASIVLATPSDELTFSQTLLMSAVAGGIASAATSPLDMIKLRLQVHYGNDGVEKKRDAYTGMMNGLLTVYRTQGIRGLFRGTLSRVLFHTPSTALTMALFETCKRWWLAVLS